MKCKLCEDRLLEYLYGELGEEDAAAMERHLEASEACRREYEGLASVLETVAEAEEDGPSPAMHTRIMGHAEEARTGRRSRWAWMFRPAVTTSLIGAIAAGVYFTTLRHKPPSYLDERIVSEESLLGKARQRSAPPSSSAKVDAPQEDSLLRKSKQHHAPSSSGTKTDSPGKEAKDQGFPARLAEPPVAVEQEAAAPTPARMKAGAPPTEEDRFVVGNVERAPGAAYGTRARSMALPASPDRDLVAEKTQLPGTIARARDLASEGQCDEAGERVEAYAIKHPKDEVCGAAWLEVARCYEEKGDTRAAREMAEKAIEIPAYEREVRSFLDALPAPAE